MSKPIFLYPSLNDELKDGIFQAKKYEISYTYVGGEEKSLITIRQRRDCQ